MRSFPTPLCFPTLPGLDCRPLVRENAANIMALQAAMLAALPDPCWYYPSDQDMFERCCERGESFGFWDGDTLAGFGTLTPWWVRPETCYAARIGDPTVLTFDFQDVMVHAAYRRLGIHSALLRLFEDVARSAGGKALYCTIAPENTPSVRSFEKAGYACVCVQPAYGGMLRGYYRKRLV
ncbi:MAG: GNAT family N-acetyltransferase [Clostridiales bacterium]|nr:GNAT family N-acetyltransferase [Clostridiales bacterium]